MEPSARNARLVLDHLSLWNTWALFSVCGTLGLYSQSVEHLGFILSLWNIWALFSVCGTVGLYSQSVEHLGFFLSLWNTWVLFSVRETVGLFAWSMKFGLFSHSVKYLGLWLQEMTLIEHLPRVCTVLHCRHCSTAGVTGCGMYYPVSGTVFLLLAASRVTSPYNDAVGFFLSVVANG